MTRQKVLIAFAELLRKNENTDAQAIISEGERLLRGETQFVQELAEFVRRDVFIQDGAEYRCKVPLFQAWMKDRGAVELAGDAARQDVALKEWMAQQERFRVRSEETVQLSRKWGRYRGREVTAENIRAWLDQYADLKAQRVMFKVLEFVQFYNQGAIRDRLAQIHTRVIRGLTRRIEKGQRKRRDILIGYPGGEGKSGPTYARLYADENDIFSENVVNLNDLVKRLGKDTSEIQGVVFVDDFIGTGDSFSAFLREFHKRLGGAPPRDIRIVLAAVCGFIAGITRIESEASKLGLNLDVFAGDQFDRSFSLFDEQSQFFPDQDERQFAMRVAREQGEKLLKIALGYGNVQSAVVFESSCPNNNLPILWSEAHGWVPIFSRR